MNSSTKRFSIAVRAAVAVIAFGLTPLPAQGGATAPTELNDIPMAVTNSVKANFLVVLDNSQSMDGNMAGAVQSGDSSETRSNIGRGVLRDVLGAYQNTFRWGLMSFDTTAPGKQYIHVYYLGNDETMMFTDDCVNGFSKSHGNRPCVTNPQASALENSGDKYVTYDRSGDDPSIQDVFYDTKIYPAIWAFSPAGSARGETKYSLWYRHAGGILWAESEFAEPRGVRSFGLTDSGFTPTYPEVTRELYVYRGWGYRAGITGGGKLLEDVKADSADSTEHYDRLISLLGAEKEDQESPEIKNGALYTPLAGTLDSAKNYFSGQADLKPDGTPKVQYTSPISASCQKNFVMLLTDGMPTGNKKGGLYTKVQRTDSCSEWNDDKTVCDGKWTFGTAADETLKAVDGLRSVSYTGCDGCTKAFDVQTYVVAMGDAVKNATAVAVMNEMARLGSCQRKNGSCVDSGKKAFFASDAADMEIAIKTAVDDAVAQTGAAAAVAVSNAIVTSDTVSFQSTYYSGNWSGDLKAYALDTKTGALKEPALWSAQEELGNLAASERKIASYSCSSGTCRGVQFQPASAITPTKLSSEQEALVSTTDGAGIVNFIRGDRSGETATSETPQKYRQRESVLGDIINAEPVFVAAPAANYSEATNPGYAAFKISHASRPTLVFQGANDGMLHAFVAGSGDEAWAYVPRLVLHELANLSRLNGFAHKYYVDGTPTVGDVDFARTGGATDASPDWRTLLVGGLGKGGRGYFALDVTGEAPTTEAGVAAKVLWEFPNSSTAPQVVANLGYSFGKPVIAKAGDQGWVVLVSSGYNNIETITVTADGSTTSYPGDGKGHLFVLNAKTGELIKDISTGAGSPESPSGLAVFSAYLESADVDNTVPQVYAGDLDGNVWRFDLTGALSAWNVSKLAALVDATGKAQPVTTAPELATVFEDSVAYRFVYVGTGRYLGDGDVTSTAAQTMYGLVDDRSATPLINPLRSSLQAQTLSEPTTVLVTDPVTGEVTSTVQRTASAVKVALAGNGKKRGWYVDLSVSGERISTDPQLAFGALVFTSNIPTPDDCVPGGSSYFNILDYRTGGALEGTSWSSFSLGKALASRPVLMRLESGKVIAVIRMSDATTHTEKVPAPPAKPAVRRVSWRELPDSAK